MCYPKEFIDRVSLLIEYHDYKTERDIAAVRNLITKIGNKNMDYLFEFQYADMRAHEITW